MKRLSPSLVGPPDVRLRLLQMANRLEASVRDKSAAPKMVLFSGHDNTVMPLLVAYGVEPER